MDIVICGADERVEWDNYVVSLLSTTVCHVFHWQSIIQAAYGHKPAYLMARSGGRVHGVVPLFVVKSRMFGKLLSSIPFLDYPRNLRVDNRVDFFRVQ
jgi:hypothetical protein